MVYDNHFKGLRKGILEIQNEVRKKKKRYNNTSSKGSECNSEHTTNTWQVHVKELGSQENILDTQV